MKVVAIDYGEARIGVAGSDALGLLAHPVETVRARPREAAIARIAEIVRSRGADTVVIGLPVRQDGTEGTAAENVRRFAAVLARELPAGTAVVFQDEYRSTATATEHLRAAGRRTKSHRPVIDQAAAVVILQEWLDAQTPAVPPFDGDGD